MNKPKSNKVLLIFLWLLLANLIVLLLGGMNWTNYYKLAKYGIKTKGIVMNKEPNNHQSIYYTYNVNGNDIDIDGIGSAGDGTPSFDEIKIGDKINVYYLPQQTEISCLGNPQELLLNETIAILLAALLIPTLIILGVKKRKKG